MISVKKDVFLAIAAALNSTSLYDSCYFEKPEAVRAVLLGEMEDYFKLSPVESSQFDRDSTLNYIRTENLADLVLLLDKMGKNPFSQEMFAVVEGKDGKAVSKWTAFVSDRADQE
jgi:hypothetical protein